MRQVAALLSYSSRLFLYGPIGALVAASAAYALFWYVSANMISARLDAANGNEFLPGVTFAFADKTVGGFPFRLDFELTSVTIAQQGTLGETAWRSERVAVHKLAYRNDRFIFESDGLQSLSWPSSTGRPVSVHLTPAIARASAVLAGGELARVDVEFLGLEGRDASSEAPADRTISAVRAQAHFLRREDETIVVALSANGIDVSPAFALPLGRSFPEVRIEGAVSKAGPLALALAGHSDFTAALESWRQNAGALDIAHFDFTSDVFPKGATLSGRLTLGAMLRLEGVLHTAEDSASPPRIVFHDGVHIE